MFKKTVRGIDEESSLMKAKAALLQGLLDELFDLVAEYHEGKIGKLTLKAKATPIFARGLHSQTLDMVLLSFEKMDEYADLMEQKVFPHVPKEVRSFNCGNINQAMKDLLNGKRSDLAQLVVRSERQELSFVPEEERADVIRRLKVMRGRLKVKSDLVSALCPALNYVPSPKQP